MQYSYPIWLVIFVLLPNLILFLKYKKMLLPYKKIFLLTLMGSFLFSIPWDIIAVYEKIWYFKAPYILNIWFLGLPIEEHIFIAFVTLLFAQNIILLYARKVNK